MHIIYRRACNYCNCGFISENILVKYTDFGMSDVGIMVVKVEGSEEE